MKKVSIKNMTQEEFVQYVECDEGMSDSGLTANELQWEFKSKFNVEDLIKRRDILDNKENWIGWIEDEKKGRLLDFGYDSINQIEEYWMADPEVEPIIIAENKDGIIEVWDGFHRIGIAVKNSMENVPVIYGFIN